MAMAVATATAVSMNIAMMVVMMAISAPQVKVGTAEVTPLPSTGTQWVAFGRTLYDASRYRESVAAFERALQLRASNAPGSAWHIARGYARLGNRKQAVRWLRQARELGFLDDRATREEPAFDGIRDDPAFRAVVSASSCGRCRERSIVRVTL